MNIRERVISASEGRDSVILKGLSDKQRFWLGVLDTISLDGSGGIADTIFSKTFEIIKKENREERR